MKRIGSIGAGLVAASLVLVGCGGGGGGSVEPVSLDPALLCSSAGAQPKVINGASCVSFRSTPVVLLAIQAGDGSFSTCSGTRISASHVLTAAHCVASGAVRVTAANFRSDEQINGLDALGWVMHPAYSANGFVNDVAVVTFASSLPNPVMPILASASSRKGQAVYFAGWGLPSLELAVGAANLTIVNTENVGFKFDGSLSNTCPGDSGGPIYRVLPGGSALVGITSSGSSAQCGAQEISLFTNVQSPTVLDFIRSSAPDAVIL